MILGSDLWEFVRTWIDLVLEILKFISNPSHLASTCLVKHIFHIFAAPLLYERVAIYSWMKDGKKRAAGLDTVFCTLQPSSFIWASNQ